MRIASAMRRRTVSSSAFRPATKSLISRKPPASCKGLRHITFPRCTMTSASRLLLGVCAALLAVLTGGCQIRQDMADQPKNRPLSPSPFFDDGRSERPLLENTVARGSIADDDLFVPKESNAFPLPLTPELLKRGEERYKIFCSPCHGIQGEGNGMVALRGMKHPPSYHDARLLAVTNGYIYDVITNGFGGMLSYSA